MVITLIGYRGSGKSTVAAPLAARLAWDWIDADIEIERRAGCTIREMFDTQGESYFRDLEQRTLRDLLRQKNLVIAAGGGAVMNENTRCDMQSAGPVVWLQAGVDTLSDRIHADEATAGRRPNLTQAGGRQEIEQLLIEREPFYRRTATLSVVTDELSVEQIVQEIFRSIAPIIEKGA